jgi:hypothetical protein
MLLINLALQAMLVNFPPQPPAGLFLLISKPTLDSQNVGLSVNYLENQRIPELLEDGACRHQQPSSSDRQSTLAWAHEELGESRRLHRNPRWPKP